MRRTTISLPDELAQALEREARRHGNSASSIVRAALSDYLEFGGAVERRKLPFSAVGHSGHRTTARGMEELIADEWHAGARRR